MLDIGVRQCMYMNRLSYECNKILTDILGKIEFSVDFENTSKTIQITIKSEVEVILFL